MLVVLLVVVLVVVLVAVVGAVVLAVVDELAVATAVSTLSPAQPTNRPLANSHVVAKRVLRKIICPFLLCSHVVRVCFSTGTFIVILVSNVQPLERTQKMNISLSPNQNRPNKRRTIIGATAGLLGGASVGLLFAVPSLTSAASDDSSTVVDTAAVVQQDDTSTDTSTETQPEPGVRLRETLQALVDDGTITAEQADAVTAHIVANRPEGRPGHGGHGHGGHGGGGHRGFDGEVVAGLLGIDAETLRTELRSGKSIAGIATEQGVDVQTVIDALVIEAQKHIDLMVENGRLTETEATGKLADVTERITEQVNTARPAAD